MSAKKPATADYEKPPVQVSRSGVHYVRPADILRSQVGQQVIHKTVQSRLSRGPRATGSSR